MKKAMKIFVVLFVVLVLSGCGKIDNEKVVSCTIDRKDVINNYELSSTYKIKTKGNVVVGVESIEVVTSESEEILNHFETTLKDTYNKMNEAYGGYDINITNENGKVTSITKIDYLNLNLDQLAKDEPTIKNAMNEKNELTLEGIKNIYTSAGATCE